MSSTPSKPSNTPAETYETHAKGIRILPGQWRPHYHWEQIAWISPAWPSQDYLWLDFPEAIFTDQGLLYLSAVNPKFPVVFPDLPKVPWQVLPDGLKYERQLPNGVAFGGTITKETPHSVGLMLYIRNNSSGPLTNILLQTCAFLRGIKEFAEFTTDNKFVHIPSRGWVSFAEAMKMEPEAGPYRVGWRKEGKVMPDRPLMVTLSNQAERLVAMTWFEHTHSMVSNPRHPCMHADPFLNDIPPGEEGVIRGRIAFFEGKLEDFKWKDFLRQ